MKAAVCFEPNSRLDVVEVEQEGRRAGEARVKVKAAAWWCSTDCLSSGKDDDLKSCAVGSGAIARPADGGTRRRTDG